jgi:NADH dehydrogenase/NADH:ubiquinone oxidoreductase subunit G
MENKVLNYYINNIKYNATKGYTLLQILVQHNIDIPRYCYHEKLTIAGNCRMCLIEEDKSLKPLASCAIVLGVNDLKLYTNTEKVKKAREAVREFLLINHPLDCPICDQGGECDLQDQTSVFGSDRGRFYEYKRSVGDKNLGVFIKTSMNRCIHCTRCVRFAEELGGYSELGVVGRGSAMEISTYVSKFIDNELSGNLIDLCPVGALISKPFSYSARPWELSSFETVDIFDSFISPIRVDTRGNKILRILPSLDKDLNEN